jgi:hypothetical protein
MGNVRRSQRTAVRSPQAAKPPPERNMILSNYGQDRWLEELRQELRAGGYRPQPLLRVWIPKSNGGQRPLGIPCIRDRVVEMAALLVQRFHETTPITRRRRSYRSKCG